MTEEPKVEVKQETLLKASHQGKLSIAGFEIGCYVLDTPDKLRVLSRLDIMRAIGRNERPTKIREQVDELPNFLRAANLKPFISSELFESTKPIHFVTPTGKKTIGYRADILKDICYVFIDAQKSKALKLQQVHIAERCELLVRGFASVGLRALVDEATGFQELRPRDDLQRYLDAYLLKEYSKWISRFPDEFFENIFKMRGWTWKVASTQRPGVVGKYINNFIYERLAPKILDELKIRNPPNEKGNRKAKHHQFLTPDVGHPKLQEHLSGVMAIQRVAGGNWKRFLNMLDLAYPRYGHSIPIAFDADENPSSPPQPVQLDLFNQQLFSLTKVPPPKKGEEPMEEEPKTDEEPNEDTEDSD